MAKSVAVSDPTTVEKIMSVGDIIAFLGVSRRTIERLLSSGRFPQPDCRIGKLPRWKPSTVRAWIEAGGSK